MAIESRGAALLRRSGRGASAMPARRPLQVGILVLVIALLGSAPLLAWAGRSEAPMSALPVRGGTAGPDPTGASTRSSAAVPLGIVNTIPVGSAPAAIAYDSGKHELFVANANSDNVSVIAEGTGAVVATIRVGSFPYAIAYDSGRNEVFVANLVSSNVSVISDVTNQVVATVSLAANSWPTGLAYDSGVGAVFVAEIGSDSVEKISDATNSVVGSVSLGSASAPYSLAYDSGLGQIFVSLFGYGTVAVIDDSTLMFATVPVGQTPIGVAYDPVMHEVFVANNGSNSVSVIDDATQSVVATIPVGSNPVGIAYGAGHVAFTYTQSVPPTTYAMLGVIADVNNTVVATVGLYGGGADAVVYDTANGGWYVADTAADRVVVVVIGSLGYDVTFTETGLPSGAGWLIWFNGTGPWGTSQSLYTSSLASLRITAGNGTYTFTVLPVTGYRISPSSGSVTVSGAPASQTITFAYLYAVTFTEAGLPAGTTWSVTFAGTTRSTNTTTIVFSEVNGTHSFTVGDAGGYTATPASGSVTVNGAATGQSVQFAPPGIGSGSLLLILGAAVVVAVVVAAIAVVLRMRRRAVASSPSAPPPAPVAPATGAIPEVAPTTSVGPPSPALAQPTGICPACGLQNDASAVFCNRCATRLR